MWSIHNSILRSRTVLTPIKHGVGRHLLRCWVFLRNQWLRCGHQFIRRRRRVGSHTEVVIQQHLKFLSGVVRKLLMKLLNFFNREYGVGRYDNLRLGCPTPLMMRRHAGYSIFLLNAICYSNVPKGKVVVRGQEGMHIYEFTTHATIYLSNFLKSHYIGHV
jgi:hypothetical protein